MYRSKLESYFATPPLPDNAPPELVNLLTTLAEFREVIWRAERSITFFGTFKSGKSTLINALLGADVLPSRVLRATGITTIVHYASNPSLELVRNTGQPPIRIRESVRFDERAHYILLDLYDETHHDETLCEVRIGLPLALLQKRCLFVDTPGLMDDPTLTAQSYRALRHTDLAIMVLSAYQLLSNQEKQAITLVQSLLRGNLIFLINQMDLVSNDERASIITWARTVLQGTGNPVVGQPRIFATQARPSLEARKRGYPDISEPDHNGLLEFEQWLHHLLESSAWEEEVWLSRLGRLRSSLDAIQSAITHAHDDAQNHLNTCRAADAAEYSIHASTYRARIADDRARLATLATRRPWHLSQALQHALAWAETLIATDPAWPSHISHTFYVFVDTFLQRFAQGVRAALVQSLQDGFVHPPFVLNDHLPHPANQATQQWLSGAGFWADLFPNRAVLESLGLTSLPISPIIDEAFIQASLTAKQPILDSLADTAQSIIPLLFQHSDYYLAQIDQLLTAHEITQQRLAMTPSPAVRQAQQRLDAYTNLAAWCATFLHTIDAM